MSNPKLKYAFLLFVLVSIFACEKPAIIYNPTPVTLAIPEVFKGKVIPPVIPSDNPLTKEGIELGKKLFYDPILSANHSLACASCHQQQSSFTNNNKFAKGIDGIEVNRNTIQLFNTAWNFR